MALGELIEETLHGFGGGAVPLGGLGDEELQDLRAELLRVELDNGGHGCRVADG